MEKKTVEDLAALHAEEIMKEVVAETNTRLDPDAEIEIYNRAKNKLMSHYLKVNDYEKQKDGQ